MAKNNLPKVKGIVKKVLPNTTFRVELEDSREVLAYLCGKMRHFRIKILPGDEVTLELPSKEAEKGRIVYRHG